MESLTGGELAGIVIGSLIAGIILIALLIYGLRIWLRGPTKGSDVNVNLENKVVVITGKAFSPIQNMWGSYMIRVTIIQHCKVLFFFAGSNTGIGKITAHEISKKGARVIMLCRDTEKAEKTATEIRKDTGNQVEVLKLDLSSLQSVRDCAKKLLEKEEKIDILINNAGTINKRTQFNPDLLSIL